MASHQALEQDQAPRIQDVSQSLTANCELLEKLGSSLFGEVHLGIDKATGQEVAIKRSDKKLARAGICNAGRHVLENIEREAQIMRMLSASKDEGCGRSNVVCLLGEYEDEYYHWMVTEYAGKGDLCNILLGEQRGGLTGDRAVRTFRQLAEGVSFIHRHGVCHLDLSLENLLVDNEDVLKICDFGLAQYMTPEPDDQVDDSSQALARLSLDSIPQQSAADECLPNDLRAKKGSRKLLRPGKRYYAAPEIVAWDGAWFDGRAADVFTMGVDLFIMLTGVPPFGVASPTDRRFVMIANGQLDKVLRAWKMTDRVDSLARDLLNRLLSACPKQRLTVDEILAHPWLTQSKE